MNEVIIDRRTEFALSAHCISPRRGTINQNQIVEFKPFLIISFLLLFAEDCFKFMSIIKSGKCKMQSDVVHKSSESKSEHDPRSANFVAVWSVRL